MKGSLGYNSLLDVNYKNLQRSVKTTPRTKRIEHVMVYRWSLTIISALVPDRLYLINDRCTIIMNNRFPISSAPQRCAPGIGGRTVLM